MRLTVLFLLVSLSLHAQNICDDFLKLMGQSDNAQVVLDFKENCGPFDESISSDSKTKKWKSKVKGIEITFANDDAADNPEYKLSVVLLESSTNKGGYTGQLPFGLKQEMDAHEISKHIKKAENMEYTNRELGISRSYFTYVGPINEVTEGKKIKIYLEQYRGSGITSMRLRLR